MVKVGLGASCSGSLARLRMMARARVDLPAPRVALEKDQVARPSAWLPDRHPDDGSPAHRQVRDGLDRPLPGAYSAPWRRPSGRPGTLQVTVVPLFLLVSMRSAAACSSTKLLTMDSPRDRLRACARHWYAARSGGRSSPALRRHAGRHHGPRIRWHCPSPRQLSVMTPPSRRVIRGIGQQVEEDLPDTVAVRPGRHPVRHRCPARAGRRFPSAARRSGRPPSRQSPRCALRLCRAA